MIFWRGPGIIVLAYVIGFSLVANLISNALAGEGYYDHHKWPLGIALLCAAVACYFSGRHYRNLPSRTLVDKQTNEEIIVPGARPELFFIPIWYWPYIIMAFAVWAFCYEFFAKP